MEDALYACAAPFSQINWKEAFIRKRRNTASQLVMHLSRYNEVVGMYNIDPQPAAYV